MKDHNGHPLAGFAEPEPRRYRLTFDSGIGLVEWEKTLEELLVPNGLDSLLVWMLKEADMRGGYIKLENVDLEEGSPGFTAIAIAAYQEGKAARGEK